MDRSPFLVCAHARCSVCAGQGWNGKNVCLCAWRGVFDATYERSRTCQIRSGYSIRAVRVDGAGFGPRNKTSNHRFATEEFIADFTLVGMRALTEPLQQRIFDLHFLRGIKQNACLRLLHVTEGTFWHNTYRLKARCGYAFANTCPFPLFPTDSYFGATRDKTTNVKPLSTEPRYRNGQPLRPPLREAQPQAPVIMLPDPDQPIIDRWLRTYARSTRASCASTAARFRAYSRKPLAEVTEDDISAFDASCADLTDGTRKGYRSMCRSLVRFAKLHSYLKKAA
jgi:hypothetical protein